MKTSRIILVVMLLAVPPLRAQIVADGATNTLSNVTVTTGGVTVGTNGAFTLLVLSDNATLNTSRDGTIGANLTAKSNEVRLLSPTAYWSVGTNLFIGSNGSFNRLTISNGALVENRGAIIGGLHFLGSNNAVVVTGAGSLWTNSGLSIGVVSPGNRLLISNGGRVSSGVSVLGSFEFADNNTATVTGAGSTWNNQSTLEIGRNATNCSLVVSNSAFVDNTVGTICSGFNGSNCEVVVTGPGSVWSNRTRLAVGESGNRARLVVTNGGSVFSLGDVVLGTGFSSTNNRIIVAGGTLRATNAAGTVALDLRRGTNQFNAGVIEADQLRMTNTLGLFEFNGGLLTTRGAFITNGPPFVVGANGTTPAIWDVRAGVSNYFLSSDLYVGSNSSFAQLFVTNGALLNNNKGFLGFNVGAKSNLAVVAGVNSVWNNRADLDVGFSGAANQLVVTNGGVVRNNLGILGVNASSSNNVVLVAGAGSVWTNANDVYVGRSGAGNQLLVSDGGLVRNNDGYLGVNTGSSSNLAVVTGLGSVWNNAGALFLGQDDQGNRLVVTNEGVVRSSSVFFGLNTGSSNNVAVVTGSGSRWTNARDFYAGYSSARNQLVVTNGGTVVSSNGYLGFFSSSSNNLALVTGTGSVWSNSTTLIVGQSGPGNRLVVSNGGIAQSFIAQIGNLLGSNNEVVVTDPGSVWSQNILELGNGAGTNRMLVTNGGFVNSLFSYFGFQSPSQDNEAVVTGPDSLWNCGELQLGYSGSGNRLVVSNAGVVFSSSFGILGANASSTNNRLTVGGGILRVTNSVGTAVLDLRRGTNVLTAGLIEVDQLLLTNATGVFEFNGGTLSVKASTLGNGQVFRVGNSASPATLLLAGNGNHAFSSSGVSVSANGVLAGNGTASGALTVLAGGLLSPGTSIGKIFLTRIVSPTLQGAVLMELSKDGVTLTNDVLQVGGFLTYGGSLNVTHLGPNALAAGDSFRLFVASSYSGSFSNLSLPVLGPELIWTNKLLVDGSIEVISIPPGDHFWTNALGGFYAAPANWLLNSVPGPRDNAVFTNNAGYQVHWLGINPQNAGAVFNAASGIVTQALFNSSWTLTNSYVVGQDSSATAAVTHTIGILRVTNSAGDARLVIGESGRGTYNLNGGSIRTDWLCLTNGAKSVLNFNGGTLQTGNTTVSNGAAFVVGNGVSPATFELVGGTHSFANSVLISSNGLLKGSGSVTGIVQVSGTLAPGASVGQIAIAGALSFQPGSTASFELNKAAATNDSVIGLTNLFYHGTLAVTNLAGTLANGDSFKLFDFTSRFASAFTNLILPALDPGLKWRNKLMMDGSLQVITIPTRDFGVDVSHFQGESGISQASWNQMFAEGKRFTLVKATEGLTGPHDGAMSNNVARAAAAGLLVGVYHFAHPENRPTTNGAILEASNMVVYAGSAIGPGRLRPVLDIEGAATTLSTTALTDWVIAFSEEIIAQRGPGAAPIIYCSQSSANFEFDSRLANYDLWLRTIGGSDPATDDPINALGFDPTGVFNEWSFWQYSDTGSSGGINPLDLDVCHSEYKPLSSFIIPGPPPTPIQLTGTTTTTNGAFQFSFTNTPGALFTVLATTNVALPLSAWTVLGGVSEISPGQFQFSDPALTNSPQRLYRVRSP